ncbi:MAG: amidohydrolase family protein [Steroidobacteraceae bacterium]|jgi:imidazolonepropionase-like amidohydrolase|nr:amidohydrolase family protein [Steroidobacteraceae bacterium]
MIRLATLALAGLCAAGAAAETPPPVLFRNAQVVTMDEAGVLPAADVLVQDRRIARIAPGGSLDAPGGAVVVDAAGHTLIPGLAEMHAHVPGPQMQQYAEDVLLLYAAHGITTIRGMLGHPWHLELRAALAEGRVLGPRLFTSGPSLNGNSVPDVATAQRTVREQKAAGYDFLKLHPGLSREVFDAIAATAREADIPFEGHVSDDVGLMVVLGARQRAIDHLDGYMQVLVDPQCLDGRLAPGFFGVGLTPCLQPGRMPAAVAATREAGTWMAPTQVLLERWVMPPSEAELRASAAARYLPATVIEQWLRSRSAFLGLQGLTPDLARSFIEARRQLIGELHRAGVPFLLASDAPQVFNLPGESALTELAIYAGSGMTGAEALATGTVNAARYFGATEVFGRIREGLEADLVLLAANPLEDIEAVRRIEGVMLRGRWLDRAELDGRLDALAARVAARE